MTWPTDIHQQVVADQREAARLRGARVPDREESAPLSARAVECVRARAKRRIVGGEGRDK